MAHGGMAHGGMTHGGMAHGGMAHGGMAHLAIRVGFLGRVRVKLRNVASV